MLKGVSIPDSIHIEHEHFFGFLVAEDHSWVEGVDIEHEGSREGVCLNLLEVSNIYSVSHDWAEEAGFVEDHLLGVGQELGMESEVLDSSYLSGEGEGSSNER